jgi:hypothetical protein
MKDKTTAFVQEVAVIDMNSVALVSQQQQLP